MNWPRTVNDKFFYNMLDVDTVDFTVNDIFKR